MGALWLNLVNCHPYVKGSEARGLKLREASEAPVWTNGIENVEQGAEIPVLHKKTSDRGCQKWNFGI